MAISSDLMSWQTCWKAQENLSTLGDLAALYDTTQFLTGGITNREMFRTAINHIMGIVPVPFLGDQVADRLMPYLPDPDGRWKGLVPKVE